MPEAPEWRDGLSQNVVDEIDGIIRGFRGSSHRRPDVRAARNDNGVDHLYAEGQIIVRADQVDRVLAILGEPADLITTEPDRIRRLTGGVAVLNLADDSPVADVLAEIDRQLGRGVATPDHVLTVAGGAPGGGQGLACPATEPEQVYAGSEPYPSVRGGNDGAGVLVYLADTGMLADAAESHPWLDGVLGDDVDPLPPALPGGVQPIPPYTGHGTFVAGVIRCVAPATEIVVTNAFSVAGSQLESDLVIRLEGELRRGVDIFHLSIAARSRHDMPLLAFREWLNRLHQTKGAICIAPAGNDGHRRPNWPAAFPGVIAVGALGSDWRGRASFTNYGGWVDVYAPGRDLVNAYATGTYTCHVTPYTGQSRDFYGMAKWSGTSFSTPIVTGLIAARMSRTGENAAQAAEALLAEARSQSIPGVGPVLRPDHSSAWRG